MLNKTDIDKLIERLQFLKNNPNGHIDIFCTDFENDPAIANIEISYCDDHAVNYNLWLFDQRRSTPFSPPPNRELERKFRVFYDF